MYRLLFAVCELERGSNLRNVILCSLFFLTGCYSKNYSPEYLSFVRLGTLIQSSSKSEFHSKIAPKAWSNIFSFTNKISYCLISKNTLGGLVSIRLVKKIDKECSFLPEHLFLEWRGLNQFKFELQEGGVALEYDNGYEQSEFQWVFLRTSSSKYSISHSLKCGQVRQRACYRGSQYKKNIITTCNQYNEQYFCGNNLKLYCRDGEYECL